MAPIPNSEGMLFLGLMAIPFGVLLVAMMGYCACHHAKWRRQLDDVREAGNDATLMQDVSTANIHLANSPTNEKSFEKTQALQHHQANKINLEPTPVLTKRNHNMGIELMTEDLGGEIKIEKVKIQSGQRSPAQSSHHSGVNLHDSQFLTENIPETEHISSQ